MDCGSDDKCIADLSLKAVPSIQRYCYKDCILSIHLTVMILWQLLGSSLTGMLPLYCTLAPSCVGPDEVSQHYSKIYPATVITLQ